MTTNIFFTADHHFGHKNIIKFTGRPFSTIEEMDATLIQNHNSVVRQEDRVIHLGDLTMRSDAQPYLSQLNGQFTFIKGNHDRWMRYGQDRYSLTIDGIYIVCDHYALRTWNRSHYNSWNLHGHSHGKLPPQGKQWDVGVDNNEYFPVAFEQLVEIMAGRPDNFNKVKETKTKC